VREDHRKLRRQHLHRFLLTAHTTSACRIPGSYELFPCKSLGARLLRALRTIGSPDHGGPDSGEVVFYASPRSA
jgi:hypothetical protein